MSEEAFKKIMITGATGFICSNLIRSAIYEKNPWEIIGIDKISSSASLNNMYVNKKHYTHIADITDEHILSKIMEYEQPDVVIHGAALTSVDEAINATNDYVFNNVVGTQNVINVVSNIGVKKFIYLNTDEVYGHLLSENDDAWKETAPITPRNTYSATKAAAEHLLVAFGNAHKLNYNIVRMSNNYGPRQTTNKLIPRAIKSLMSGEKIKIYGQGKQIRDWMHVNDTYNGIKTVIEKGKPGEIYNIGAGQEFSNLEVAQLICKFAEKDLSIEFVEDRKGHDFRYSLNCDKLKALGWEPKIKFKDGLEDTVRWFMLNKWWLK